MRKAFISYHHANDQWYKTELIRLNSIYRIFIDGSVATDEIDDDNLTDQQIRTIIRDDYLKDTSITILLVGTETKNRKHIDWEIYSSMFDGVLNKKSGILVITLPSTGCAYFRATHDKEKENVYPEVDNWTSINTRGEYESRYPFLPARIIDNMLKTEAKISVTNWDKVAANPEKLRYLIEAVSSDRTSCEYDLSRPMRRNNS